MRLAFLAPLVAASILTPRAQAQCGGDEIVKLTASDGTQFDEYSLAIAASEEWVIVGARRDDDLGGNSGSVYAYRIEQGQWVERKLTASDGGPGGEFGSAVAIHGDALAVGAWRDGGGSAYVFRFDGSQWNEEAKLVAADAATDDHFGTTIGIAGNRVVVGANDDDDHGQSSGSAYVFTRVGAQWLQTQKLVASDAAAGAQYGREVALDGSTIVVGAHLDSARAAAAGAAYVYEFAAGFWVETKLTASDAAVNATFGEDVDVSDDVVVVGSGSDEFGSDSGSGYIFRRTAGLWGEEVKLLPPGQTRDGFGLAVSIDGDHAVFGGPNNDLVDLNSGAAYVYRYDGSRWVPFETILGQGNSHEFGDFVAMGDGLLAISAPGEIFGPVRVHAFRDLALEVSPTQPAAGDPLIFETCGGLAGQAVLLITTDVNGLPFVYRMTFGAFGSMGEWVIFTMVPPGLAGLDVNFMSIGFQMPGQMGLSTARLVEFQ